MKAKSKKCQHSYWFIIAKTGNPSLTNGILVHTRRRQLILSCELEHFIRHSMRNKSRLEAASSRHKPIRSSSIFAIDQTHELRRGVPMIILNMTKRKQVSEESPEKSARQIETHGWSKCVRRNIPPRTKNQEVGKRCPGRLRLRRQDAEDRRIDVIFRDRAHIDELFHRVLERDIADKS